MTPDDASVPPCVQVHVAVDDREVADRLVAELLERRLVACGQRHGPVTSRYWWRGGIETAEEWLVVMTTTRASASAVVEAVVAAHPYENPEVLVVPIASGSVAYLEWVRSTVAEGA